MSFGLDTLGSLFSGDFSGAIGNIVSGGSDVLDFLGGLGGGSSTTQSSGGGGSWSLGSMLKDPSVLSSLITSGAGFAKGMSELDMQKEALAKSREDEKLKYLLELAKLKYGKAGGGGGSARNANADLIAALVRGGQDQREALNSLAQNYAGALK